MTKQNQLTDINYSLSPQQYENIFNVYGDSDIGYFYNLLKTVNFPADISSDVYDVYVIKPNDTWPSISWKMYNSIFLWWAICSLNNIQNPTEMPVAGTQIKILRSIYLNNVLNNIRIE